MRLPTMKQLESAGADAGKLLDAYEAYWIEAHNRTTGMTIEQLTQQRAAIKRLRALQSRRLEFFARLVIAAMPNDDKAPSDAP